MVEPERVKLKIFEATEAVKIFNFQTLGVTTMVTTATTMVTTMTTTTMMTATRTAC